MTPQQIELVRSTWQQVLPIRAAAADLFYARLFEIAPDGRSLFRRDIHAQGAMPMATLETVVAQLDRFEQVLPVAEAPARRHVGYGVRPAHRDSVGAALLWTLGQGLGAAFSPGAMSPPRIRNRPPRRPDPRPPRAARRATMVDKTVSQKDSAQLRKEHAALLDRYQVFVKDLNAALVNAKTCVDRVETRVASLERKDEDLLKVVAKRIAA